MAAQTGARRTAAIGIQLGGLVACRAVCLGAAIDDLVLWATPARARALVRQLRAFSTLEVSEFFRGLEPPPPLPHGALEAGGFLLSAETVRELEGLDLSALELPDAPGRRVLLLDRDGIAVDSRLRERLERDGASVSVDSGPGYASMSSHPQTAQPPLEVMARVARWIAEAPPEREHQGQHRTKPQALESLRLSANDGAEVKETPFALQQPFGRLAGILAEPARLSPSGLCLVLLNAGAVRRTGPNRMWVEAARRWAARGIPTLRLDVEGLGDADGDPSSYATDDGLYVPGLVPQVLAALDALQARGVGERFIVGGLCAGAYWSFHCLLRDPRVATALMLNPGALIWDPALLPARDFHGLLSGPFSWSRIRKQASLARMRALMRWLLTAPKRWLSRRAAGPRDEGELNAALDRLDASGKRALLLFSENEPVHRELVRSGAMARLERSPNVTLERISVRDHTLRPTWAQQQAHAALDRGLERELEGTPVSEPATAYGPDGP